MEHSAVLKKEAAEFVNNFSGEKDVAVAWLSHYDFNVEEAAAAVEFAELHGVDLLEEYKYNMQAAQDAAIFIHAHPEYGKNLLKILKGWCWPGSAEPFVNENYKGCFSSFRKFLQQEILEDAPVSDRTLDLLERQYEISYWSVEDSNHSDRVHIFYDHLKVV